MGKYQDVSTWKERVYKARQAVYISVRRLEVEGASEWWLAAAVVADGAYQAIRGEVVQRRAVRLSREGWRARCMSFWNDLLRDRGRIISIILHRHLSTCTFQVPWRLISLQRILFSSLDQYLGEVPSVGDNALQIKNERVCVIPQFWIHTKTLSTDKIFRWNISGVWILFFFIFVYCMTSSWVAIVQDQRWILWLIY